MDFDDDIPAGDPAAEQAEDRAVDQTSDQTGRHLAALEKLRDMGLDVASALKNRVIYAAVENKTDDKAAKSFALVATTVQQVILLHQETTGLREKRRESRLAERKARAKQITRRMIDSMIAPGDGPGAPGAIAPIPRIEKERQVRRVRLDELFRELDDDIFEGLSVAEVVERACRLLGVEPDPTLRWPEWAELRGETGPEPPRELSPTQAAPARAKPAIPARFSGASAIGLNGRAPPVSPSAGPRERAPP